MRRAVNLSKSRRYIVLHHVIFAKTVSFFCVFLLQFSSFYIIFALRKGYWLTISGVMYQFLAREQLLIFLFCVVSPPHSPAQERTQVALWMVQGPSIHK